jgi:hypothetical protein
MQRAAYCARLGVVALWLSSPLSAARADEAANPPVNPPLSAEALSLQGFGAQNPLCVEWGDGCSVCLRDDKDAAHCSTPGIACQPAAIACRREKTK